MILWYMSLIAAVGELPAAIAAAESWIARGGYNPKRFTWECSGPDRGFYQLYVSCPEALAR